MSGKLLVFKTGVPYFSTATFNFETEVKVPQSRSLAPGGVHNSVFLIEHGTIFAL
ncbi:MAG: hypothetical protein BWX77_00911 [Bacteroidetes bacterium ADurb.Bin090]|jgi:hypothetical protein|nr:MAG: hypothetical protein BWX77_00911 [Bacteroidetes bacterium ADurb.Bin090]